MQYSLPRAIENLRVFYARPESYQILLKNELIQSKFFDFK